MKSERAGWDIFIWYGGLVMLGKALNETRVPTEFANAVAGVFGSLGWPLLFVFALLIYFYAHYAFASITAHVLAMYPPFLAILLAKKRSGWPGRVRVRLLCESLGRPDALRDDTRADVLRSGLRADARLVAYRPDRILSESCDLGHDRLRLVEVSRILVARFDKVTAMRSFGLLLACRASCVRSNEDNLGGHARIHALQRNARRDGSHHRRNCSRVSCLTADKDKLNPLWDPIRFAKESGQPLRRAGAGVGHFLCVDGFGPVSEEEQAAGLQGHGEAHRQSFETKLARNENGTQTVTLETDLPMLQERLTRTYELRQGENIVYVRSKLQSLLAFRSAAGLGGARDHRFAVSSKPE